MFSMYARVMTRGVSAQWERSAPPGCRALPAVRWGWLIYKRHEKMVPQVLEGYGSGRGMSSGTLKSLSDKRTILSMIS